MDDVWTPRRQGDAGELSAIVWLKVRGAAVFLPLGHSPDYDLVADFRARPLRVQVKTSTCWRIRLGGPRYAEYEIESADPLLGRNGGAPGEP
jgi:hypothetical protein